MIIVYYILVPIVAYIIDVIVGVLMPIVTLPVVFLLSRIERNPQLFRFRLDMVIQGVLGGLLNVYLIEYIINKLDVNIGLWWLIIVFAWLSYLKIVSWCKSNPISYEVSLNISPIIGYIVGFIFFL